MKMLSEPLLISTARRQDMSQRYPCFSISFEAEDGNIY